MKLNPNKRREMQLLFVVAIKNPSANAETSLSAARYIVELDDPSDDEPEKPEPAED